VKLATGIPLLVQRSSGSRTTLPTRVTVLRDMMGLLAVWLRGFRAVRPAGGPKAKRAGLSGARARACATA